MASRHLEEAEEAFRRALEIHPVYAEARHDNLANLMRHRGRTGMALTHYRAALKAMPMLAEGHYNLGHRLLQLGHFKEGLAGDEWRWRPPASRRAAALSRSGMERHFPAGHSL